MTVSSIRSPPMSRAMAPRFGSEATTFTVAAANAGPVSGAADSSTTARGNARARRRCAVERGGAGKFIAASVLVGAVRADDRDPLEEHLRVLLVAVAAEARRGAGVQTGALHLEADLLELRRREPDHPRGGPGTVALAVREARKVAAQADLPALHPLSFEIEVTAVARDDVLV